MTDQNGEPTPAVDRSARAKARIQRVAPFAAGVVATFAVIALYGALNPGPRPLTERDVTDAVTEALASQTPAPAFSELVYQVIQPSLVLVETDRDDQGDKMGQGLGSGVVVDQSGLVLTALHVVADASAIELTFADGTQSGATLMVEQPENDIAVLAPDSLPGAAVPAVLGNPAAVRIGSEAFIVGHPFGLYGSISAGVVSGIDRSFSDPDNDIELDGLIQVDAAVNRGASGGPLLNRAGQVVGIVTALVNPTEDDVFIGIGLAVPIDVAGGAAGLPAY
jgi:S1-C subfamily serine protease